MTKNGFGICVGGLLKPQTVCQYKRLFIAYMSIFERSARQRETRVRCSPVSEFLRFPSIQTLHPSCE